MKMYGLLVLLFAASADASSLLGTPAKIAKDDVLMGESFVCDNPSLYMELKQAVLDSESDDETDVTDLVEALKAGRCIVTEHDMSTQLTRMVPGVLFGVDGNRADILVEFHIDKKAYWTEHHNLTVNRAHYQEFAQRITTDLNDPIFRK